MKLGGKYTARLEKPGIIVVVQAALLISPIFLPLFLLFLAVFFLHPFPSSCGSLGKGLSRNSDATEGRKTVSALRSHHHTTDPGDASWDYRP